MVCSFVYALYTHDGPEEEGYEIQDTKDRIERLKCRKLEVGMKLLEVSCTYNAMNSISIQALLG